jgi:hypothetical protein
MAKKKSIKPIAVNRASNTRIHPDMEPHKWKPGKSGNPAGRPKREVPSETLCKMLEAQYGPDAVKQLQKTIPEPWRSKAELTVQEILTWVMLRRAMQTVGDVARREVFDGIEGRPTLKISGPQGGPIETVTYDLKRLSAEKIKTIRAILAEAVDPAPVP